MTDAPPASPPRRWSLALVSGAYLLLAIAAAWPLTAGVRSLLPGPPSNDTGVYIWNLWTFHHQLFDHGSSPLWTDHILQPGPAVDLSLHNYTIFQDALGLLLVGPLGIVGAFNSVWIGMQALSALGVFLLARRVTLRDVVAFLAGGLFAFAPTMIARSTAHQSLVAAAPLAFFLLFVLRAAEGRKLSDAALAGACAAWAGLCDAYFGVYCILLLIVVACARSFRFERLEPPRPAGAFAKAIAWLMVVAGVVVLAIVVSGGGTIGLFGWRVRATTLYTPMLILTVLAIIRAALASRARGRWRLDASVDRVRAGQLAAGTLVCAALLLPIAAAAWQRARAGELQERVLWRSSPPGVDLAWFFVPNPNHPLAPPALREFVTTRPDSYPENVASIPYVAMLVIGLALRRARPPRTWMWIAAAFGLLALGPFLTIAHVNTHIPGPWALVRYLPVIGAARTPTRFAIPMLLALAVLFAWALDRLGWRNASLALAGAALAFELLPVPRSTASARIPAVYSTIAADRADVSVLEIPFGIWDGTSQVGYANIATVYYQTAHEKRLVGGYLSRVPRRRLRALLTFPTLRLLAQMSEGKPLDRTLAEAAREDAAYFVQQARIRYVVIDPRLAPAGLRQSARELLTLRLVQASDGLELYRTGF